MLSQQIHIVDLYFKAQFKPTFFISIHLHELREKVIQVIHEWQAHPHTNLKLLPTAVKTTTEACCWDSPLLQLAVGHPEWGGAR